MGAHLGCASGIRIGLGRGAGCIHQMLYSVVLGEVGARGKVGKTAAKDVPTTIEKEG